MKDVISFGTNLDYASQDAAGGSISIFSLMEVLTNKTDTLGINYGGFDCFHALCQQSFPGPLVGSNAAPKDVNRWIDDRIIHSESLTMDLRKGELLRLLFSLLKISCQHYGKLRSPFGTDPSLEETDGPETAVAKLFASARTKTTHKKNFGSLIPCMQNLPSEGHQQTTAVEVQNLLVSGRRKEALHCAVAGQLWGPALVLAAQLGEKFYVDTVKQMAHHQFISGSPLRTLCLLIAGQPADVFSADSSTNSSISGAVNTPQKPAKIPTNDMLDDWEDNLAIVTANKTKDDDRVITHLGDCLWKERGEIIAAHTCYLVAEVNFESYSDSARLCLIGANHLKFPRTYASPEAIQRTELYEYSKVLGNSQFILSSFQPYKLIYAYMLAEVGKVPDSLRYCQAISKLLKNSGRAPEVEMWKSLLSSLEERLRTNQQGGYGTNIAPAKLVGKLITSIDRSLHRMMGAPPSPLPPMPPMPSSSINGNGNYSDVPKVASSQSTMAISSLIPSASVETMSGWASDNSRKSMHSRSISEPDFSRSPVQDGSKDGGSLDAQSKASLSGGSSRFGRIGSQLFQKTVGWVSKSRQAKLGETNKFYYDEKLKRWVEEGVEVPAEEVAPPPPPRTASFQNGMSDYSFKAQSFAANGGSETNSSTSSEHSSGIPPISPSPNQFSARGRTGVRSRYVDTFNKIGGAPSASFQFPSTPSVKPLAGAKFFVPAASDEQKGDAAGERINEAVASGEPATATDVQTSYSSPPPVMQASFLTLPPTKHQSSLPMQPTIQRFPSMGNITPSANQGQGEEALQNGFGPSHSRSRSASWSGIYGNTLNPNPILLGEGQGAALPFMPPNLTALHPSSSSLQLNGGTLGDDLHEVEL